MAALMRSRVQETESGVPLSAGGSRARAEPGGRSVAGPAPAPHSHDLTLDLPLAGLTIRVPYRPAVNWFGAEGTFRRWKRYTQEA